MSLGLSSSQTEKLLRFVAITNAEIVIAKEFLQNCVWDSRIAIESFFLFQGDISKLKLQHTQNRLCTNALVSSKLSKQRMNTQHYPAYKFQGSWEDEKKRASLSNKWILLNIPCGLHDDDEYNMFFSNWDRVIWKCKEIKDIEKQSFIFYQLDGTTDIGQRLIRLYTLYQDYQIKCSLLIIINPNTGEAELRLVLPVVPHYTFMSKICQFFVDNPKPNPYTDPYTDTCMNNNNNNNDDNKNDDQVKEDDRKNKKIFTIFINFGVPYKNQGVTVSYKKYATLSDYEKVLKKTYKIIKNEEIIWQKSNKTILNTKKIKNIKKKTLKNLQIRENDVLYAIVKPINIQIISIFGARKGKVSLNMIKNFTLNMLKDEIKKIFKINKNNQNLIYNGIVLNNDIKCKQILNRSKIFINPKCSECMNATSSKCVNHQNKYTNININNNELYNFRNNNNDDKSNIFINNYKLKRSFRACRYGRSCRFNNNPHVFGPCHYYHPVNPWEMQTTNPHLAIDINQNQFNNYNI